MVLITCRSEHRWISSRGKRCSKGVINIVCNKLTLNLFFSLIDAFFLKGPFRKYRCHLIRYIFFFNGNHYHVPVETIMIMLIHSTFPSAVFLICKIHISILYKSSFQVTRCHWKDNKRGQTHLLDQGNHEPSTNKPKRGPATPLTKLCEI